MDGTDKSPVVPSRPFLHLFVVGTVLVPLASIPYFSIRRHLSNLSRSIQAVSTNVTDIQRGLFTKPNVYNEKITVLANEIRDVRMQLHAAIHRVADSENAQLKFQREATEQLRIASVKIRQLEKSRLSIEAASRQQIQSLKVQLNRERIPRDVMVELSASLGDTAAFIEETEIQLGWPHTMPRDRGIDKLRALALKLHRHAMAQEVLSSKQ